jgi:diphosphomevalonate decarboxylase
MSTLRATSVAHPNIALAKYWGKRPYGKNLPAVPSLSVTLAGMSTTTTVSLVDGLTHDELVLDGKAATGRPLERVTQLLDLLVDGGSRPRARVESQNDFPTAAGLASSASAFAALCVAGNAALRTDHPAGPLSCMARRISASAGRSLFGGFVVLPAGVEGQETLEAEPLAPSNHWDLRLVVAVTARGAKAVGSTEGMIRTAETSPLYGAWVESAPRMFDEVRAAVIAKDLDRLGPPLEQSALTMHATALAARPGLLYWNAVTMAVMQRVRELRADGLSAYFTIDAGPHVKVLVLPKDVAALEAQLNAVPGVLRTIVASPGEGARIVEASG